MNEPAKRKTATDHILGNFPDALCLWQQTNRNGDEIDAWAIGDTCVITQQYARGAGWDAFVAVRGNSIADTIEAIRKAAAGG